MSGLRGWSRGLLPARSAAGDDGDVDIDVSVFQFTLGIPGLPDEQVPRILGLVTCVLLVLNHMSTDVVEAAQARSEVVALLLGATCIALPTLNRAINFNNSSILSQAERTVANTKELFYLSKEEGEDTLKELAWASFALLKNTNASFVLFAKGGKVVLARGSFKIPGLPEGIPISPEYPMDKVLTKSFEVTGAMEALLEAAGEAEDNAAAIGKELCFVAKGIDSLVVRKVGDDGALVAGAKGAKAFSRGQARWIHSMATKLEAL